MIQLFKLAEAAVVALLLAGALALFGSTVWFVYILTGWISG